jgi:preprotein translocase subunit SecE
MAVNPLEFLQQTRSEVAKVTWPSRNETLLTTVFVIIMVLLAGLFLFLTDQVLAKIVDLVLGLST